MPSRFKFLPVSAAVYLICGRFTVGAGLLIAVVLNKSLRNTGRINFVFAGCDFGF